MLHPESVSISSAVVVDASDNPRWTFPLHSHDHHLEISLVQSGEGTLYCDGHSCTMQHGDVIVKNAGTIHAEQTSPDAPLRQICLSFAGVEEIAGHPGWLLPAYMSPVFRCEEDYDLLSTAFSYLADHWQEETRRDICLHLTRTVLEIVSCLAAARRAAHAGGRSDARASETVMLAADWLNGHYMQKITLNALAERFYISPYYLDRKFKAYTGYSINQYVIDRRMGEAQRMLIFEDKSIKEIALAVGYDNLQYFYAAFKKCTGKTPTDFRTEFR